MTVEHFLDGKVQLFHGDSREVLKTLADNSVDSVCTDHPYALVSIVRRFGGEGAAPAKGDVYARASAGFMGKTWDTGETAFAVGFWREVMRVLKPGGYVLAASGTRTYHRLACAIEDAGFEIRDMVQWLYGSGFPKSHAPLHGMRALPRTLTAEEWRHFYRLARVLTGSALKPACEPWVMARKPLVGTIAENLLAHGVGALNIGACRIGDEVRMAAFTSLAPCAGNRLGDVGTQEARRGTQGAPKRYVGRWPANVIHDGSEEVTSGFPSTTSGKMKAGTRRAAQDRPGSVVYGIFGGDATIADTIGDSGSASRFFYSAKADADDRLGSKHATVKPRDLMQYICRLVTPPKGTVLDPFAGSGSTGEAAWREGFNCILIEREAPYADDIRARLRAAGSSRAMRRQAIIRHKPAAPMGPLFDQREGATP